MTGDSGRKGDFGYDFSNLPTKRIYEYNAFTFPACKLCNSNFGEYVEAPAEIIIGKILEHKSISIIDADNLLDWLDKIRIGLWLGFRQLNKNWNHIVPHYFISSRLSEKDRLLIAYEIKDQNPGLGYIGVHTLAFTCVPACYGIRINNLILINASSDHLFSYNLGFPYPQSITPIPGESSKYNLNITNGKENLNYPLINGLQTDSLEIYQPIIPAYARNENSKTLYDTEYVKARLSDKNSGKGSLFIKTENCDLKQWILDDKYPLLTFKIYNKDFIMSKIYQQILFIQNYVLKNRPSIIDADPDMNKQYNEKYEEAIKQNETLSHRISELMRLS